MVKRDFAFKRDCSAVIMTSRFENKKFDKRFDCMLLASLSSALQEAAI
jgi:hypothetical protein